MIRRAFLKLCAGLPLVGVRPPAAIAATATWVPVQSDSLHMFTKVKMEPGESPEFPVDYPMRHPALFMAKQGGRPGVTYDADYIPVPTYDVGFSDNSQVVYVAKTWDKLRDDAKRLLLVTAEQNRSLRPDTVNGLVCQAEKRFGCPVLYFVADGTLVAVPANDRRRDNFFLVEWNGIEVFADPTHYRNPRVVPAHYAFGTFGLVVLDSSLVVSGRVSR